jgi:hypothetical protein
MTDQELKDLVASFAEDRKEIAAMQKENALLIKELRESNREAAEMQKEMQKETEHKMQETAEMQKETERKMQEVAAIHKEIAEMQKETDRIVKKISKQMGGIDENQGHHAEQFFQSVFEKKLEFGGIKYDEMIPNLAYKDKGVDIEFDIALLNGNSIALIEVKNRIHPSFVQELAEYRIEKFREYFPRYRDCSAYLGIAGFSFSDEVLDRASSYGIGVIRQAGDSVEIDADNLRAY